MYGPVYQYLMIYRHPFDVAQSLLQKGWNFMKYDDAPFLNVVKYIKDGLDHQRDFESKHTSRCHSVFYEKLAQHPEPVLKGVFTFLDEPWEPQVLRYDQHPHDWGRGDPEAEWLGGFRPRICNWKSWSDEQVHTAQNLLQEHLDGLGYSAGR